jgi:hypothetical protein
MYFFCFYALFLDKHRRSPCLIFDNSIKNILQGKQSIKLKRYILNKKLQSLNENQNSK